ncbi:MAG: hypothetical protein Q8P31_02290 [Bacillota bacterium]|nr:hypothetical protein [Bacillota bacterium]
MDHSFDHNHRRRAGAKAGLSAAAAAALERSGADEALRRTLNTAGWLEIALFGLPLIFAGRRVARYVREHDPHIYKEYGVARIVMGLAFLLGARHPEDRRTIARIGSVFYGCNIIVSVIDLALANVAHVELAVVALSSALSAALGRLSAYPRTPR